MTLLYKVGAGLVTVLLAFLSGRASRPAEIQVQEKVVEKHVQGEETVRTVVKDRIITRTVTVKPDGTTVTKDTDQSLNRQKDRETKIVVQERWVEVAKWIEKPLPKYSIGLSYWPDYRSLIEDTRRFQLDKVEGGIGYRVVGNVWLELGVRRDSFGLGLRYEF